MGKVPIADVGFDTKTQVNRRRLIKGLGGAGAVGLGTFSGTVSGAETNTPNCYGNSGSYSTQNYEARRHGTENIYLEPCDGNSWDLEGIDASSTLLYLFTNETPNNYRHWFVHGGVGQGYTFADPSKDCESSIDNVIAQHLYKGRENFHDGFSLESEQDNNQGAFPDLGNGDDDIINDNMYTAIYDAVTSWVGDRPKIGTPLEIGFAIHNAFTEGTDYPNWDGVLEWYYGGSRHSCCDHVNYFSVTDTDAEDVWELEVDLETESMFSLAGGPSVIVHHHLLMTSGFVVNNNDDDIWDYSDSEEYEIGDEIRIREDKANIVSKSRSRTTTHDGDDLNNVDDSDEFGLASAGKTVTYVAEHQ